MGCFDRRVSCNTSPEVVAVSPPARSKAIEMKSSSGLDPSLAAMPKVAPRSGGSADIGSPRRVPPPDSRRSSIDPTGGKPSVSIEGFIPQARPDYFDISVKTGRGEVFPLSVHSGLKVREVHKLIASRPDSECSAHAMRLVYASKVISHEQESQLSKFEVKEGDVFSMVVVRPLPTPLAAST